jgi:hypothetical protein
LGVPLAGSVEFVELGEFGEFGEFVMTVNVRTS